MTASLREHNGGQHGDGTGHNAEGGPEEHVLEDTHPWLHFQVRYGAVYGSV